jgi:hypothetical protein
MTPTVADIFALLGLRHMGALAHPLMAVGTGPDDNVDILNDVPLNYNEFIKHMKGSGASPISYKEECCFYLF